MAAATLSSPAIMNQNMSHFTQPSQLSIDTTSALGRKSARSTSTESANSPDPDRAPSLSGSPSPSSSSSCDSPPLAPPQRPLSAMQESFIIPKIEELSDDEIDSKLAPLSPLNSTIEEPSSAVSATSALSFGGAIKDGKSKRGRGRPRKHPLPPMGVTLTKVTKGRSKTGCITCRRRKKKCDEARPECMNCVKNSVVCEGYPERTIWRSGKEKADESVASRALTLRPELPALIDGIESSEDRFLFDHFINKVSRVLTVFDNDSNPFQEHLVPLAIQHRGLMHSLLCLAGSHMAVVQPKYQEAQAKHFLEAIRFLRNDVEMSTNVISGATHPYPPGTDPSNAVIHGDKTVAQMLLLCLNSICLGEKHGEYRMHMDAARTMLSQLREESAFHKFLFEFFMFHDVINCLTTLDRRPPPYITEQLRMPSFFMQPERGAMLGVVDGLFTFISRITVLRDSIRQRRDRGVPPVDYKSLSEAVRIDGELQVWTPPHNPDSHGNRFNAALLYRQCTWIYLYRTILPSQRCQKLDDAVSTGLQLLSRLPPQSGTDSVLLMPVFILGVSAFNPEHRPRIDERLRQIQRYSGLRNVEVAREVVQRVWELMDSGEERKSWDWEEVIREMDLDFLVT